MVAHTLVLAVLVIVVVLSPRRGAIVLILLGLAVAIASECLPTGMVTALRLRCFAGAVTSFPFRADLGSCACGLCPGAYHVSRLQGAVVIYLSLATIFAAALQPDLGA